MGAVIYPGNIRELKNLMERALLLLDGDGPVDIMHLPPEFAESPGRLPGTVGPLPPDAGTLKLILSRYEAVVLSSLLDDHGWNQTATARALGISRRSLIEKMQRYALKRAETSRR